MIRSQGFIVPRNPHAYLTQYHLEGHGLNIAAVSPGELADAGRSFFRALILAVDRQTNTGSLGSKLALFRAKRPELLIGDFDEFQLERALKADGSGVEINELLEYLHFAGEVSIKPLTGTGRGPNDRSILSWGSLLDYLKGDDVQERLGRQSTRDERLSGYLTKPLRAD